MLLSHLQILQYNQPELVKQYTDAYAKKGDATYELGDDANSGNYFDVTDVSDTTNTASGAFKSDGFYCIIILCLCC